jgi:hypothetical protein
MTALNKTMDAIASTSHPPAWRKAPFTLALLNPLVNERKPDSFVGRRG